MARNVSAPQVFEGNTIFEAYNKLKRSLGDHAVILSTKTIKRGGILGFWGRKVVQITASGDMGPGKRPRQDRPKPKLREVVEKVIPQVEAAPVASAVAVSAPVVSDPGVTTDQVKKELKEIREMVREMQEGGMHRHWPDLPPAFQKAYQKLQGYDVAEDIARALIHRWKSHYPNYTSGQKVDVKLLESFISEMLIPAGPIRPAKSEPTVVMMVGPTGVGKTTTVAKLAALHKIQKQAKVALITIDTYRIAAVEQLRTYADLIGVPLQVVSDPSELKSTVASLSDRDLILVDSAGRSPRNQEKMVELKAFVEAAGADELHLVLSVSVSPAVMKDTLERYRDFPVGKLLLTKLDEAVNYGVILSIIARMQKPIGYLTTGQEVPDDIEVATTERLSRLILQLDKVGA